MERVFVDANILYSRTVRDWLFALSTSEVQAFELFASEDVLAEVVYHFRRNNPSRSGGSVKALVDQMRELVVMVSRYDCERARTDYLGADPNDLHLHAAAKDGNCSILLTDASSTQACPRSSWTPCRIRYARRTSSSAIWRSPRPCCWIRR